MKNYEDMAKDVLHRIDEYENERKMKRAKMTKVAASVTPVCAAAVVGVGLWKGGALTPHNDQLIASTVESTASDVILSVDNDTSADKHSANNNNADRNGEPTTSVSATDRQTATADTTIPRVTENGKNVVDGSGADNASVEANTPVADDKSSPVSDNNENTNNESQRATDSPAVQTEAPVQQTTPPVQQTEPATQSVPTETGNPSEDNHSPVIYFCKLEWNGLTFCVNDQVNATAYTRDQYIGKVSEFEGVYSDAYGYPINPADSVYTTTENVYVLLVIKADGTIIAMTNPAYSDGVVYRPHTEDVPYEDVQNYNGGFQAFN
ncbi:hypothetical protein [Ruminococcus flavefaciens]|uniref:Uncharacterized protein n=1 Tax=Ruminococcus flavefaciens 007c TaxID=1341157 RepID=W7UR68_RUMFL|nr:hypothetical protein [Ruminococcus flavefaciens]EWM53964.1 hypothetical protein RF007C_03375 [Ruminococcus flavefaciens 007c]